jgi:Terminase RNaseH-like domain/Terminase large subunit, T4likevirus-type, N-terminal
MELYAPDGYLYEWESAVPSSDPILVQGYQPHSAQWLLHESPARFRILTCGRRWGKTFACVAEMMKQALEQPRSLCWWVAPFHRQTMIAYRLARRALSPFIQRALNGSMRLELTNESVIEFRSAAIPDTLRGEGVHLLVVDEAAMIKREAWEEALRPTLTDTKGRAIFISTPKGRNWFFELFMRGQDPAYPEYQSFRFPTSSNPLIPQSEIEDVKKTLPENAYRQEYEAEFLEESAGVFRNIQACVQGDLTAPQVGKEYVLGVDLARKADFTVLIVMDVKEKQVVAFDRFNQVSWQVQIERIVQMAKQYNDAHVIVDSTGLGDVVIEALEQRNLFVEGFLFTNKTKQQMIENLQMLLEREEIHFPNIPELIHELQIYQYEMTKSGNMTYNAPKGAHDDCVMSLGLACWALKEQAPMQIFV